MAGAGARRVWETNQMAEPVDDLMVVSSVHFVALTLACPACGAPVALLGRLELTTDGLAGGPCYTCGACGTAASLVLRPAEGAGGIAPIPR